MRERKKEATKTTIMNAAIELINERGFAETTMHIIARKADVALRTLYNYFPSKESIVATYVNIVVQNEQEKSWNELLAADSTFERLGLLCRKSAEWMKENPVLAQVYTLELDPRTYIFGQGTQGIPKSGIEELVTTIMEMGQKTGDISISVPVWLLTRQFLGFYHFSVLNWLNDIEQNPDAIFQSGLKVLFAGIEVKDVSSGSIIWAMFC